jgi:hypothetical protein
MCSNIISVRRYRWREITGVPNTESGKSLSPVLRNATSLALLCGKQSIPTLAGAPLWNKNWPLNDGSGVQMTFV